MIPVLTPKQMQEIDSFTINKIGIPGCVLMENAGNGVVDQITKKYGSIISKSFLIICGKGNNGGDGFVVARYLHNLGAKVTCLVLCDFKEIKGDAAINFKILRKIIKDEQASKSLKLLPLTNLKMLPKLKGFDFIVDAIFGTGFSGKLSDYYLQIIKWVNNQNLPVISIDIPSGVNGETGSVLTTAIKSDLTVTMGYKKTGLLIGKSVDYINDLKLIDISIPNYLIQKKKLKTFEVELGDVNKVFPKRLKTVHKYSVGKVLVLAGSVGYTGAATLASLATIKTGAGAVILCAPNKVYSILAKKLTEVMVFPLDSTNEGSIALSSYSALKKHLEWADVLVIGPGISLNSETSELVLKIISEFESTMVIDADAITILSKKLEVLKKKKSKEIILTPHLGEFSRLVKLKTEEIENNKLFISKEFAKENNVVLVLKGAPSITVTNDGYVFINSTGNPGMATAGSGDVLSGIIAGLSAQGLNPVQAAYSGVFLHGLSGDIAKDYRGIKSLTASDILQFIPEAIKKIEEGI